MQFRQKALAKLQSPEELDLPVRFARPRGWLVLIVTVAVMAAGGFWAVTGSVSSTVSAPGLLTHVQGSYVLQSPVAGQVTEVLAREGEKLPEGAPLVKVRTERGVRAVRTVAAGRVISLPAKIGAVVATGASVATVERIEGADDPLVAMLYVPTDKASTLRKGASVDLTLQSVPTQQFGVLRGEVLAVGRAPQTRQQISSFLGDDQLAEEFSADGRPVAVVVRLERAKGTESGFAWSTTDGPPHRIESRMLLDGSIRLDPHRPVDWLLP